MQKQKTKELKDTFESLKHKKIELTDQIGEQNLSFPEARDRLLTKVKEDNSEIQKMEKKIQELKKLNDS